MTDQEFDRLISEVMDELPQEYISRLDNVAIVIADEPSQEQRTKLKLHCNETLFGLYEGIPLTRRGAGYSGVVPDKITLFKTPLYAASISPQELRENVKRTLWHEIAHFYGLNHDDIHRIERKS